MAVQVTHGRYPPPAPSTREQKERERLTKMEAKIAELSQKIEAQKEER